MGLNPAHGHTRPSKTVVKKNTIAFINDDLGSDWGETCEAVVGLLIKNQATQNKCSSTFFIQSFKSSYKMILMEITTYIWIKYYKKIQVLFYDDEFDKNPNLNKDEI